MIPDGIFESRLLHSVPTSRHSTYLRNTLLRSSPFALILGSATYPAPSRPIKRRASTASSYTLLISWRDAFIGLCGGVSGTGWLRQGGTSNECCRPLRAGLNPLGARCSRCSPSTCIAAYVRFAPRMPWRSFSPLPPSCDARQVPSAGALEGDPRSASGSWRRHARSADRTRVPSGPCTAEILTDRAVVGGEVNWERS